MDRENVIPRWFIDEMEGKLAANNNKAHWSEESNARLFSLMMHEMLELIKSYRNMEYENVISECADVANFAYMVADNARRNNLGKDN